MILNLTLDEAKALHNLIDIAVRAQGIDVASAAAHFAHKIDDAARAEAEAQARAQEEARARQEEAPPGESSYKGIPAAEPEIIPPAAKKKAA